MNGPLSKQPPPVLKPDSMDSSGDSVWPCPDCPVLAVPCWGLRRPSSAVKLIFLPSPPNPDRASNTGDSRNDPPPSLVSRNQFQSFGNT